MQILLRILLALGSISPKKIQQRISFALHHVADNARLHEVARGLPDVEPEKADRFVDAAIAKQTSQVPASLLVALGWGESRFDEQAQPACGVMQVYPQDLDESPATCVHWRTNVAAGMEAGVREIEMMLADNRVRGDLQKALLYRACGNRAFDGTCDAKKYTWVTAAIARWHAIAARSSRDLIPDV